MLYICTNLVSILTTVKIRKLNYNKLLLCKRKKLKTKKEKIKGKE